MNDEQANPGDELLVRLSAEAAASSPPFSQALHEKVMGRIRQAPAVQPRPVPRFRPLFPTALAAAAAIAVGVFSYRTHFKPDSVPSGKMIARAVPSVPAISNPVKELDLPIVAEWTSDRYAFVDRDGERFLGYMARQLDVAPQRR
jgi:hypothetical protein